MLELICYIVIIIIGLYMFLVGLVSYRVNKRKDRFKSNITYGSGVEKLFDPKLSTLEEDMRK